MANNAKHPATARLILLASSKLLTMDEDATEHTMTNGDIGQHRGSRSVKHGECASEGANAGADHPQVERGRYPRQERAGQHRAD
jgi:hypothetical protein